MTDDASHLERAEDRFIDAWGRMGSVWGISRTMAEVHALLFIVGEPMCTDDIMDRLRISRGNASMSLRALLEWGVVTKVIKRGERREYHQAEQDVWSMFRSILRERLKREVVPVLESLKDLRAAAGADTQPQPMGDLDDRLERMHEMLELIATLGDKFTGPTGDGLEEAARLLASAISETEA